MPSFRRPLLAPSRPSSCSVPLVARSGVQLPRPARLKRGRRTGQGTGCAVDPVGILRNAGIDPGRRCVPHSSSPQPTMPICQGQPCASVMINGPPLSPWQLSLPPSSRPAINLPRRRSPHWHNGPCIWSVPRSRRPFPKSVADPAYSSPRPSDRLKRLSCCALGVAEPGHAHLGAARRVGIGGAGQGYLANLAAPGSAELEQRDIIALAGRDRLEGT